MVTVTHSYAGVFPYWEHTFIIESVGENDRPMKKENDLYIKPKGLKISHQNHNFILETLMHPVRYEIPDLFMVVIGCFQYF
jgi:hypothetical protein